MKKPIVVVSGVFPQNPLAPLEEACQVRYTDGKLPEQKELADAQAWIVPLTQKVDEAILDIAPNLQIIANYAVGYDNIDLSACQARKILVSNTPDVLTEATAELTFALLLSVARRVVEADHFLRQGE